MRTTMTLDDDVSRLLATRHREGGASFKRLVNELLRAALVAESRTVASPRKRVATPVFHGVRLLAPDVTRTSELLARTEGETYR